MDSRHDLQRFDGDADQPHLANEVELRAVLAEGDQEVADGQSEPFADVMRDFDEAVSRIKALRAARAP